MGILNLFTGQAKEAEEITRAFIGAYTFSRMNDDQQQAIMFHVYKMLGESFTLRLTPDEVIEKVDASPAIVQAGLMANAMIDLRINHGVPGFQWNYIPNPFALATYSEKALNKALLTIMDYGITPEECFADKNNKSEDQDRSYAMGKKMSDLIFSLCNLNKTDKFIKDNQLENSKADRFKFCLLFFNISSVVFWVNYTQHSKVQDILDVMLKEITNEMSNNVRRIRVGDYILTESEMNLFDPEANKNTTTSLYTIFDCLYDERISQYIDAISQQMDIALEYRNKDNFFALDPMGKLFIFHFTGEEFTKQPNLYLSVSQLLATYSQVITNGIVEILNGKL